MALVSLLQRRAQETTGRMQQWLEEHYQAEMKRYGGASDDEGAAKPCTHLCMTPPGMW